VKRQIIERDIPKDSSPGYPYVKLGTDNETVLEKFGDFIWDVVVERLNLMLEYGDEVFSMSPVQLIDAGLCDPIKGFIKNEPHPVRKIVDGKLRIISSVSLVDQIIERLLGGDQNQAEIAVWESCPSAPGMGLHDDGLQSIAATFRRLVEIGKIAITDISGWDWSVKMWELMMDAVARYRLAGAHASSEFAHLLRCNAWCVGNSVFVLSNGEMWAQTVSGVQLSGRYFTSSTNSRMRLMASMVARVWAGLPALVGPPGKKEVGGKSMGDDCFEVWFEKLQEMLCQMGHKVKYVDVIEELNKLRFCSQQFHDDGTAEPEDPTKTLYKYFSHKPSDPNYPGYEQQLHWVCRHAQKDMKDVWRVAAARMERAVKLAYDVGSDNKTTQSEPWREAESHITAEARK